MERGGRRRTDDAGSGEGWWRELSALVDYLEAETARIEGRTPRSSNEVWTEIERLEVRPASLGTARYRYR
jgi:hypothetical protein